MWPNRYGSTPLTRAAAKSVNDDEIGSRRADGAQRTHSQPWWDGALRRAARQRSGTDLIMFDESLVGRDPIMGVLVKPICELK
ncbi:hypothetical protein KCP75_17525 [Salmonella enterica subsp. enterica]|nr:hypothetical protein KCP75_17525 [Salmonella enterica subsp. enterica]